MINLYNVDCMEFMKGLPDKAFDLAIVDPPYGLDKRSTNGAGKLRHRALNRMDTTWDVAPSAEYFAELRRVSYGQIIWGGNYFDLPPSRGFAVWDKKQYMPTFSRCEYAWISMSVPSRIFEYDNSSTDKIHPTQKPVALYRWLLQNYAKPGQKILDTHGGSMSIAIACDIEGFDLDLCELDPVYFQAGKKRLEQHQSQPRMFAPEPPPKPEQLSIDPAA